jgi:hypothetical protein
MGRKLRRHVALTVALLAVLAGGTAVALGATSTGHTRTHARHARLGSSSGRSRGGVFQAAAGYLGVTPRQLKEALRSGKTLAQIAAATPGKSEAGLVAAIVAAVNAKLPTPPPDLEARVKVLVNRSPSAELNRHARLGGARHGALRAAALAYLGMTRHQLIEQVRSGKSIAEVANSTPGKSAAGLTEALMKVVTAKVNAAVSAHRLEKKAEAARLTVLRSRISRLLDRAPRVGRHFAGESAGSTPAP